MRTINVSISDVEYDQFGLPADQLSFTEFVDIVTKNISKPAIENTVRLAEKYKLSRMTMEDINAEVKAVRDAKGNN